MMYIRFFAIFISFFIMWLPHTTLCAFQVELANDTADIIDSKRILLRFSFDTSDNALYRDSLRFSTDCADLELRSWQSSMPASSEYIVSFKQNKLIYKESFLIDVQCKLDNTNPKIYANHLKNASIYIACLLLGNDGKNKSRSLVIPLSQTYETFTEKKQPFIFAQHDDNALLNDFVANATTTMTMHQCFNESSLSTTASNMPPMVNDDDAVMFDKLLVVWNSIVLGLYHFLDSMLFFYAYALIFLIVLLFLFKRFFPTLRYILPFSGMWATEFERFCGFVMLGGVCNFLKYFITKSILLGGLALYFLVISLYYLRPTTYSHTFLGKLKVLIGMLLVAMVLPMLLKAYFLQQALLFNVFLSH